MNPSATDRPSATRGVLSDDQLRDNDAYWRACNYLAWGTLYLRDNPLLREPLSVEHLKLQDQILDHLAYARERGVDKPEIQDWKWTR
jgi:phosphoketolase